MNNIAQTSSVTLNIGMAITAELRCGITALTDISETHKMDTKYSALLVERYSDNAIKTTVSLYRVEYYVLNTDEQRDTVRETFQCGYS